MRRRSKTKESWRFLVPKLAVLHRTDSLVVQQGALIVGLGALTVALPVLGFVFVLIATAGVHRKGAALAGIAAIGIVFSLFAWVNSSKVVAGDWVWYLQHYKVLQTLDLSQYLGRPIGGIVSERTEPLYYAVAAITSRLTQADPVALTWVVSFFVYVPIGVAALLLSLRFSKHPAVVVTSVIIAMSCGLTFTLSTQLVRQEMAASFVALGLVLIGVRHPRVGIFFLIAACATHNSAVIPAAAVVCAVLIVRMRRVLARYVVLLGLGFSLLGLAYLREGGGDAYQGKSDGQISLVTMLFDALVICLFVLSARRVKFVAPVGLVAYVVPGILGFLLGVASQPLPLLRMYFYLEALRGLMLCAVISISFVKLKFTALACGAAILGALGYVLLRIASSPFVYEQPLISAIFWSPWARP
jgi:hypothetical protein